MNELPYTIPGGQQIEFTPYRIGGKQGGAAEVTGSGTIQSENFVPGGPGWRILGNGDVEFNAGNFRGDITGASGTFSGAIVGSTIDIGGNDTTSFHVDADGFMWMGATIANKLTAPFRVTSTGNLTANNATLTGSLRTGTTGPRLFVGGTSSAYIDFFSGAVGELDAGYINVSINTSGPLDYTFVALAAPALTLPGRNFIELRHYEDGNRDIIFVADGMQFFAGDVTFNAKVVAPVQNQIPVPGYTAGWFDFGLPWFGLGGESDGFGRVFLRGLVSRIGGALPAGAHVIATLPVGYRPLHDHLFNVRGFTPAGGEISMRLDVLTNGNCIGQFNTAVATSSYISFSGVSFRSVPF